MTMGGADAGLVGFRPLYRQVYEKLLRRLAEAVWQPGQIIPSEGLLARELGVSQGTIRKALDALTAENLLVRRQGRGTFVAEHDDRQSLFRFFRLRCDLDGAGTPRSEILSIAEAAASAHERGRLALVRPARVVRIRRRRTVGGYPCILEAITVPAAIFPGLAAMDLPNTLYSLYATHFGVTISNASEKLKALGLAPREALLMEVAAKTPALEVDRTAFDLAGRPVEWRVSLCLTDQVHYRSELF